jgi:hypothetical protein
MCVVVVDVVVVFYCFETLLIFSQLVLLTSVSHPVFVPDAMNDVGVFIPLFAADSFMKPTSI